MATVIPTWVTPTQTRIVVEEPQLTNPKSSKPGPFDLPYGGTEVKQFYDELNADQNGWWYSQGTFTNEDFNGLLLIHESSGAVILPGQKSPVKPIYGTLNAIVGAQQLYIGGWKPPYCPSETFCSNGAFNFWAAYSESTWKQLNLYIRGDKSIQDYTGFDVVVNNPLIYMQNARALGRQAYLVW
ncbi:MAG TPA: hypothetical protein VMC09_17040 [Anaerolineales bacterium]|nr:hypothetical protein [Anaerolineales bacterium]